MKRGFGSLVKRGRVFYYRFKKIDGCYTMQRVIDETGNVITVKEKAESIVDKLIQEQIKINNIENKAEILIKVAETKGLLTQCKIKIDDLETSFFTNPQRQEFSQSSARMYRIFLQRFMAYIKVYHPEVSFLSDITTKIASTFMDDYRKTGISNRTYNYCLLCLSIVFRLYLKEDNPFKDIPKRKLETEERLSFTVEQLACNFRKIKRITLQGCK